MGINPNTIARAYGELERKGVTYSVAGKGSFISNDLSVFAEEKIKKVEEKLRVGISEAKNSGVSKERLIVIVGEEYDRD